MFEVFFGILFIITSLYIAIPIINKNGIPFISYSPLGYYNSSNDHYLFLISLVLACIGLITIFIGIKRIITTSKVKKYGLISYGIVDDIIAHKDSDGTTYEYSFGVVDMDTYEIKHFFSHENGIPFREYKLNDFVMCKYYKNDFVVLDNVTEDDIPNDIKNKLESLKINNDDE